MNSRSYRLRWGWLLIGTVAIALTGAWIASEAAPPAAGALHAGAA